MYLADRGAKNPKDAATSKRRLSLRSISPNVFALGTVSMLTDVSSEAVASILPVYLFLTVGLTPLALGAIDGLYQGASALVRVFAGFASDRWRRHKEVAAVGYGLSAAVKPAFLVAGTSAGWIGALVLIDRFGKGLRAAPRDALISLSCAPSVLGLSFGVHRAMDTFGAMLGPLLAFLILAAAPGRFDAIFVVSFCFAFLGLAVLVLFVRNKSDADSSAPKLSIRAATSLLADKSYRRLVIATSLLALVTISDAFIYLALQQRLEFSAHYLPLFYVGTAASFMLFATPIGRLADRVGRVKVFVSGYAALLLVYTSLLIPSAGVLTIVGYLVLFGLFFAATDGVLMAAVASQVPESIRGSGMALLTTATGLSKLLASLLFGALWTWFGLTTAVTVFGVALAVVAVSTALVLRRQ